MPRYRLYVGPAYATQQAAKLEAEGYGNVVLGTCHVHFSSTYDRYSIGSALFHTLGYLPSLREIEVLHPLPEAR